MFYEVWCSSETRSSGKIQQARSYEHARKMCDELTHTVMVEEIIDLRIRGMPVSDFKFDVRENPYRKYVVTINNGKRDTGKFIFHNEIDADIKEKNVRKYLRSHWNIRVEISRGIREIKEYPDEPPPMEDDSSEEERACELHGPRMVYGDSDTVPINTTAPLDDLLSDLPILIYDDSRENFELDELPNDLPINTDYNMMCNSQLESILRAYQKMSPSEHRDQIIQKITEELLAREVD